MPVLRLIPFSDFAGSIGRSCLPFVALAATSRRIAKVQRERNEKRGTVLRYARNFFNIGVNTFKLQLYRDLERDDPSAPGYVAFPNNCEDRFFQELTSESRVPVKRLGQVIWKWTKPDRQPNEILDATVYAVAASLKYGTNWISDEGWQKLRDQFDGDDKTPSQPEQHAAEPPPLRRGVTITQPGAKARTIAHLLAK
jgi:phage terminase large subunit GpA-like protein